MNQAQIPAGKSKKLRILVAAVLTFTGLAILIVFLARAGVITVALALLMLVGLMGLYIGFGILIVAHLMVRKLEE